MSCTRSCPSRADGVVRAEVGGGRTFGMCRAHRPRRAVGPFGLSGPPPVSEQGHRAYRSEARARTRTGHAAGAPRAHVGRPRRVDAARRRATPTEVPAPVLELRPEPIDPSGLPAPGTGRTARAALASLAAHVQRPPRGGLAHEGS